MERLPLHLHQRLVDALGRKDVASLRLTSPDMLARTDRCVKHLSVGPRVACASAAALDVAAARWPHVGQLDLTGCAQLWQKERQLGYMAPAGTWLQDQGGGLPGLVLAARAHWPQLTEVKLSEVRGGHVSTTGALQCVAECVGGRLRSLTTGFSFWMEDVTNWAGFLAQQMPGLTSLHWGFGSFSTPAVAHLAQLADLRELQLGVLMRGERAVPLAPLSTLSSLTRLDMGSINCKPGVERELVELLPLLPMLEDVSIKVFYKEDVLLSAEDIATGTQSVAAALALAAPTRVEESRLRRVHMDGHNWRGQPGPSCPRALFCFGLTVNLEQLLMPTGTLDNFAVVALTQCPRLQQLEVYNIDVPDDCDQEVFPALQKLKVAEVTEVGVPLARLMPQLVWLESDAPWPLEQLHAVHGHPTLAHFRHGYEVPTQLAECLASLPKLVIEP